MSTVIPRETIELVLAFHGHVCPGCTRGIRMAEIALRELGTPQEGFSEPLWVRSEVDNCGVDAIRYLVGATAENGRLSIELDDRGAITFWRPSDQAAVRIVALPGYDAHWTDDERALVDRVRNHIGGEPTEDDRTAFVAFWKANGQRMLDAEEDTILSVERIADYRP